jgi:hypothetical protein
MAERVPQSVALEVMFMAYLAADHVTPATGKTIAITISKNHAALGNPNAGATNATAISNGCYYVALDATDTGTAGNLWVHGAEGTIDDVNVFFRVVNANTGGWAALPNAAADAAGGLPISDAGGLDLDAIKTQTDKIGDATIGLSAIKTAVIAVDDYVDSEVAAIKTVTDKLDTAMELDGAVYRFTANALEQGPGGGGVGSDANIVSIAGVPVNTATAQLGVNVVSVATNAIAADSLTTDAGTELADAILGRSVATVEGTAGPYTLATAVLKSTSRTRRSTDGTQIEIYRTDGATLHATQQLTPDPTGQPVSEIGTATAA